MAVLYELNDESYGHITRSATCVYQKLFVMYDFICFFIIVIRFCLRVASHRLIFFLRDRMLLFNCIYKSKNLLYEHNSLSHVYPKRSTMVSGCMYECL